MIDILSSGLASRKAKAVSEIINLFAVTSTIAFPVVSHLTVTEVELVTVKFDTFLVVSSKSNDILSIS